MTVAQRCQLLVIFIFTLNFCTFSLAEFEKNDKTKNIDKKEILSPDFEKFLKDMESRVFLDPRKLNISPIKYPIYTTHIPNVTKNKNMFHSQKAALRDVLMLKLVSYYEDKYKLAYSTTSPTSPGTTTTPAPATVVVRTNKPRYIYDTVIESDIFNIIDDRGSSEVVVI